MTELTLGTAGQDLITICTLHCQGVPGSSVKQQPAPPSQETVLIVRERTQETLQIGQIMIHFNAHYDYVILLYFAWVLHDGSIEGGGRI